MKKYRTLIAIEEVLDTGTEVFLQVRISGWKPHRKVLLPASLLPEDMLESIETSPGPHECILQLLAAVDLAAEVSGDLGFQGPWTLTRSRYHDDPEHPLGMQVENLGEENWDEDGHYTY